MDKVSRYIGIDWDSIQMWGNRRVNKKSLFTGNPSFITSNQPSLHLING